MLVLSRKPGERIVINDTIEVEVVSVRGDKVRLGVVADRSVPVRRGELERDTRHLPDAPIVRR